MIYLDVRCPKCNQKLLEAVEGSKGEIKCPRCGQITEFEIKAKSVKHTVKSRE